MILIVDDHEDTRRMLARLLRQSGYAADTAPDGAAALDAIRSSRPDLVVLDYNMPGMNGLEVLETIGAAPDLTHLPVIMFTAIDGSRVMESAERLGVQGFIRKGALNWPAFLETMRPYTGPPQPRHA